MHPIERLRYVARSHGVPAELLVSESATALRAFARDPAGLVAASRRVLDRQLTCGPLWWLCSRMLCALDPFEEAADIVRTVNEDDVTWRLDERLPVDSAVVVATAPFQSIEALARRGDVEVAVIDYDDTSRRLVEEIARTGVDTSCFDARAAAASLGRCELVIAEALAVGDSTALVPTGTSTLVGLASRVGLPTLLVAGHGRVLPGTLFDSLAARWASSGHQDPSHGAELLDLGWVDEVVGPDRPGSVTWPVAPELLRLDG